MPGRALVLLRHGRTGDNAGGRIQGQLDRPLDHVGRAQADEVAPLLAAAGPTVLLSSDLARARATAAPVASLTGLTPSYDPRLRELDLGAWQGLTSAQARERFPEEHAAWRAGRDVRRGGGETYAEAGTRAAQAVADADLPPGGVLLAVTHGGTARALVGTLLGDEPDTWWRWAPLGNCCWTVLVEHPRGWRVQQHGSGPAALRDPLGRPPGPEPVPVRAEAPSL